MPNNVGQHPTKKKCRDARGLASYEECIVLYIVPDTMHPSGADEIFKNLWGRVKTDISVICTMVSPY